MGRFAYRYVVRDGHPGAGFGWGITQLGGEVRWDTRLKRAFFPYHQMEVLRHRLATLSLEQEVRCTRCTKLTSTKPQLDNALNASNFPSCSGRHHDPREVLVDVALAWFAEDRPPAADTLC